MFFCESTDARGWQFIRPTTSLLEGIPLIILPLISLPVIPEARKGYRETIPWTAWVDIRLLPCFVFV